jgi:MSHA biogenesis protein MshN
VSVINKMLRDLDRRADAAGAPGAAQSSPAVLTRGTASVASPPASGLRAGRRRQRAWALAVLVVCLAAAAWWLARPADPVRQPLRSPAASLTARSEPATAPAAPAVPDQAASGQASAAPVAPSALADNAAPKNAQGAVAPPVSAPAVATAAPPPAARVAGPVAPVAAASAAHNTGAKVAPQVPVPAPAQVPASAEPGMAASSPGVSRPGGPTGAMPVPVTGQDAALEALAQAQRLWAAGSRDAAIDLLTDALALLERLHGADLTGAGSQVPLEMLRELVRMHTAQGQPALVLAVLRRYERVSAGQADLWALRANAAQRQGQHAESAQSYRMALRLRPGEPRWMLGAAVSLAALGQTGAAAELAEQAQALAPVSPEVLAYLRQLGVPLRER